MVGTFAKLRIKLMQAQAMFGNIKTLHRKIIFLLVWFSVLLQPSVSLAQAQIQCSQVLSSVNLSEKVSIPTSLFDGLTQKLRSTLGGKLATVWRSEWKSKLSARESGRYVDELLKRFLTAETYAAVVDGLHIDQPQFVQFVHRRLYELKKGNRLHPEHDQIMVRDAPPAAGTKDSTFTYYTKSISDGDAKHQMRVRTYIREIKLHELDIESSVEAFQQDGSRIVIQRIANNEFRVQFADQGSPRAETWTAQEFNIHFKSATFYAPHGKSFKLEVKTALKDQIGTGPFEILGGDHMVQKLDVSLTPRQVTALFRPFGAPGTTASKRLEAQNRLTHLKEELFAQHTDLLQRQRIEAVLQVIETGVNSSPDFLLLQGATHYERSAFESSSGFQTTIDWAQVVYRDVYKGNQFLNPFEVTKQSSRFIPNRRSARHVELKFPVNVVDAVNGLLLYDENSRQMIPTTSMNILHFVAAAEIYSAFVTSSDHPGKFNFLQSEGREIEPILFEGD
ncbi:MAG: hypothetical protein ACK5WZ_05200 [Pseudobdellovibrionaceae bacterium]